MSPSVDRPRVTDQIRNYQGPWDGAAVLQQAHGTRLYRNNQGKWSANSIKGFLKEVNLISQMERCQFVWSILSASGGKLPYGYLWNQGYFWSTLPGYVSGRGETPQLWCKWREFNSIPTHSLGLLETLWNLGSLESTESSNMTILQN